MLPFQLEVSELFNKFNQLQKKQNPMAQTTQRGMPTSYVKKDGTTFQYCGSGAPVAGLAAATRAGGQLKRTEDNTPEACPPSCRA